MSADFELNDHSLRLIFTSSPAVMLLIDPGSQRIVAANKAAERFYGWKSSEMETMSINDINTFSKEGIKAEMEKARKSKCNYFSFKHRLANGEVRNVEVYSGKAEINGKKYLHSIVHDVTGHKQAKEALKDSEHKYQTLINQAPEALFLHKLDGSIVDYNQITLEKYGYSADEILQLKTSDIDPDYEEREDTGSFWKKLNQKKQLRFEARHMKKDGTIFPVEVSLAPVEMKGEKYYLALANDISERKHAEILIRHNEDRLREAEKTGRMGHVDWIVAEQRSYWSDEVFQIYERDPKLGVPTYEEIMSLHMPEDAARLEKAVVDALQKGRDYDLDLVAKVPSGKKKYLHIIGKPVKDASGAVTNIRGIVQDITERKQAENDLRIKEKSIESSHNAIALVDLDGKLTYVNPSFLQMWGYENQDEVLAKRSVSFWTSEKEAQIVSDSSLSKGSWKGELIARRKDGSTFVALVSANLVIDEQGKPIHKMASFIDISESKRAEEALRESEEKYRILFDASPLGITVSDNNGKIVESNRMANKLLGITKNEHVRRHINGKEWRIVRSDLTPMPAKEYASVRALKEHHQIENVEMGIIKPDENIIWINVSATPINLKNFGVIITYNDITDRKKSEEALHEYQELLAAIYRNAPLVLMVVDSERRIQQVNGFATKFAGREVEEMLGLRGGEALRCMHALDDPKGCGFGEFCQQCVIRNTVLDTLETGKTHLQIEAPYYFQKSEKEVQEMTFLASTTPITVKDRRMVLVTLQDITERRKAEEEVRKNEEKLQSIFRVAPTGIGLVKNRILIEVNPKICEMTGYQSHELINKNARILYPSQKEFEFVGREKYAIIKKHGTGIVETRWQKKDGTVIDILLASTAMDVNDPSRGVIFTALDITERKKAEEALKQSASQFRQLIETLPISLSIVTVSGKILYVNPKCRELFETEGIPDNNEAFFHWVNPEDRQKWLQEIKEMGAVKNFEMHLKTATGKEIWALGSGIFIQYENQTCVLSAQHDITEVKNAQDALRESELRVRRKLESILLPDSDVGELDLADIINVEAIQALMNDFYELTGFGIAIVDVSGKVIVATGWQNICTQFHRVHPETKRNCIESDVYLSSGIEVGGYKLYKCKNNLWDMATPIMVGKHHAGNLFLGQFFFDDEEVDREFFRKQAQKYGFDEDAYLDALDRVPRWSRNRVDTVFKFYTQFATMISQLSHSNLKLAQSLAEKDRLLTAHKESEARFAAFMDNMPITTFIKSQEHKLLYVNNEMIKIYSASEWKGKTPYNILPKQIAQKLIADDNKSFEQGYGVNEYVVPDKEGNERIWETHVFRIDREKLDPLIGGFSLDITERKKMLEELLSAKDKAEESDKLKTAFINNISHEIRTPLNVILGFGEILAGSGFSTEQRIAMLNRVQQSSHRLMNTISDYMDMAMIVSGTMVANIKEFALRPVFEEITGEAKQLCNEKNLNFKTEIPSGNEDAIIHSEPEFVRKILGKLLDNALKFTPEGSVTCGYNIKEKHIEFFVRDTGYGISSDKLEMIFDMFGQEDTSMIRGYEGSGLGLTISRGLVMLLGGEINVVSEKDKGSVFTFTIPTGELPKSVSAGTPQKTKKASKKKPLILIAEDEESNYKYLTTVLQLKGYEYILAVNGLEAVECCRQNPEISIVLMDIKMPEMDGVEATRKIREFRPEMPIIATTAYAQTGDKQRFLAAGCNEYLAKPIKSGDLMTLIRKYAE